MLFLKTFFFKYKRKVYGILKKNLKVILFANKTNFSIDSGIKIIILIKDNDNTVQEKRKCK